MAQDSKIQWTTHTFNPWRGCTKVSDGCKHCYADTLSKRNPKTLGIWGPNGTRVVASESMWREPVKWNALAVEAGDRHRVFCASLADVFEGEDTMPASAWPVIQEARKRLFDLICRTPQLDWLLLTKRPQNALRLMVDAGLYAVANPSLPCPQPNVWIGTSVENQATADERIPLLLQVPAVVRFLSMEPLLGEVSIGDAVQPAMGNNIDWVIVGGESGGDAREFNVDWARDIIAQCRASGAACFVKQFGGNVVDKCEDCTPEYTGWPVGPGPIDWDTGEVTLLDKKGGDWSEWPADLRVREFPEPAAV